MSSAETSTWRQRRAAKRDERQQRLETQRVQEEQRRARSLYRLAPNLSKPQSVPGQIIRDFDQQALDNKWMLTDEVLITPGPESTCDEPTVIACRWRRSGVLHTKSNTPIFVGDSVHLVADSSDEPVFITMVDRVPESTHAVPYFDACNARWRKATCFVEAHLEVSWSVRNRRHDGERLHIDDIESFGSVRSISREDVGQELSNGRVNVAEDEIQGCLEGLLGESFHKEDWGGEENDLYSSGVIVDGVRVTTAFLLKGRGEKTAQLTLAKCGRNGDQITRLFQSPAELFVVQYVGPVHENLVKEVRDKVRLSRHEGREARYCIIDGTDTARLLRAAQASG